MNKPHTLLLALLGLLATSRPGAAQRLASPTRPSAAAQRSSDDFPGQIRPAEEVTEAAPAPPARPSRALALALSDVVDASDLEIAHLQYIRNKVSLGMPLTKSENLFVVLWMQRFPGRPRAEK